MTASKSVITADHDAVVSEIQIAATPERVFKALTDERELVRWFTNASCPVKFWKMDARLGGRYSYTTEKGSVVINNLRQFECHGEILEFDPPRLLVYTWYGNWHENQALQTVVRWELMPDAAGTRVKVTHSGLAQQEAARKDYSSGWSGVLENLQQLVESSEGGSAMATMRAGPDQDAIVSEIHIAAPAEQVFQALVDPGQVLRWWGQAGVYRCTEFKSDLRTGGSWHSAGLGPDGRRFDVAGEYLEIDPPRLLVYSWVASWTGAAKTTVRWELETTGPETLVRIRHSGLAAHPEAAHSYKGWPRMLEWLRAFIEKGETVEMRKPISA